MCKCGCSGVRACTCVYIYVCIHTCMCRAASALLPPARVCAVVCTGVRVLLCVCGRCKLMRIQTLLCKSDNALQCTTYGTATGGFPAPGFIAAGVQGLLRQKCVYLCLHRQGCSCTTCRACAVVFDNSSVASCWFLARLVGRRFRSPCLRLFGGVSAG